MGAVCADERGSFLQTSLIKMILTFQPPHKFFFHFNILLYFVWGFFCFFFLHSLITEFQINIFRERQQNNQGQGDAERTPANN